MAPVEKSIGDPAVGVLPVSAQAQTGTHPDEPAHPDTDGVVPQHLLPQNWSRTRRWLIVLALSLTSLMVYVLGCLLEKPPETSGMTGTRR